MDSLNILNLKVEKANAMLRYRRLRNLGTLLRFMELLVLLIMIFRFSVQLPFNPKLSGEYFRGLTVVLFSPGFVFVVGNAIIITLFLKSGWLSHREGTVNKSGNDFCAEYVENSVVGTAAAMVDTHNYAERKIHRSRSENLSRVGGGGGGGKKRRRQLRRSERERCWKSESEEAETPCAADEQSSEEFRRTVEAFIARHQRSLREEEFSAILG